MALFDSFHPRVSTWFQERFGEPTPVQAQAWEAIGAGKNALVVAPTGSGKTLAAFLTAISRLIDAPPGTKVLYISPLKALGAGVERNLRKPIEEMGLDITVGVRSGDTPQSERRKLLRNPPDILITTPESAYLMLTSRARATLATVHTVIVDEIHALAGSKRGVHLALSLERLAQFADFQRIGLSATVRPLEAVAEFLGGNHPVEIIAPPAHKNWELRVHGIDVEVIAENVYRQVMGQRSTLIFVNARRAAEKLTSRINELYAQEHEPEALAEPLRRDPAQLMKSTDTAGSAPTFIARAHHGSVSTQERAEIEAALKEGSIRAVVATSSLELGIDMGAVDLVIQVESPLSVAAGLQRVGRAGHTVGATSTGEFYPQHQADLFQMAVIVSRMRQGLIEEIHIPRNPLDVLTQQTIAEVSQRDIPVGQWYDTVRRAYPYRDLSREVFDSIVDLVTGYYPSTDFAELKPHLIVEEGVLKARPSAQRVAVTSGGTIPDRGLYGVFLIGAAEGLRRVGELDEEMVYESRVGDVFTLGASSWRIEEITKDQVLVSPAPGHTGRLPFWTGDQTGRPAELGRAVGQARREVASISKDLDERAYRDIVEYLDKQREATGVIPDERTLVLERFRDELGDWRAILHSPYGRGVNAAWALAVGAEYATDEGIVMRVSTENPPTADLFALHDPAREVADKVSESALFAARFRECAGRALLLPRRHPGRRSPLWQQRHRAAKLLDAARKYPTFPIVLETVRECLHDVYDLPALEELHRALAQGTVRIKEVTTASPSPFAASMLFTYTGAFMYEEDRPQAESRLDSNLLSALLGTADLRDILDPDLLDIQPRQPRTAEEFADLLREAGPAPITPEYENFARALGHRVIRINLAGRPHFAQAADAPLLDKPEELAARWARSRGPFTAAEAYEALGVSPEVLDRLPLSRGHFRQGIEELEYCDADVLDSIRRRSLARARKATEPVSPQAYANFLLDWQHITTPLHGVDGLYEVLEQLAGVALTPQDWENRVLPARVEDYAPPMLDELTASGEIRIVGTGASMMLLPYDHAPEPPELNEQQREVVEAFDGGAYLFQELLGRVSLNGTELRRTLWELVAAGVVSPDSFSRLRARASGEVRRRTPADTLGRWSLTAQGDLPLADLWLRRYGVVTRGSVTTEGGNFAHAYRVLSRYEEHGQVMRGMFIEGLGAAQFSSPAVIDRVRSARSAPTIALAACDPANPYGAALPWPRSGLSRASGAVVVLGEGQLYAYLRGKSLSTFGPIEEVVPALQGVGPVEKIDGRPALTHPLLPVLRAAGAKIMPRGIKL
ncbi:DEAD/DEAH box helicase [Corynebacterium lowii]|uniref:ATP-dependent RNA helicase RhlE n=1 Tax=Corynebacterium lowii TaxID=1544413 RepID=A0A0N8W090_9CORY|nr:DEAD/DEAH box helicase [Corynebacterium lowii]KQB86034.1 ATP-dependent RNA helicase RhlE [Corynebacterium lowii]MDP9850535.1 ATP-dependent Lhr-like helicase [Corynebacterium lowii]